MSYIDIDSLETTLSSDQCIKCNICTASCPVAAVTDLFPGPKAVGPQLQRLRQPAALSQDQSVDYCNGCGVCSLVCPHGVQIAEMNAIARSVQMDRDGIPLRNRLIGRPEPLGKVGSMFAPLSNIPLAIPPLRWVTEKTIGIHRKAPFPSFSRRRFRSWFKRHQSDNIIGRRKVVYFHGCSTNYYEPKVGEAVVKVLEHFGCKVSIAEQNCCGLPMQSNGEFDAARENAKSNIEKLAPYVRENYVIVGSSTSCTLALKHDYPNILGLQGRDVDLIAKNTYDIFEFLAELIDESDIDPRFRHVNEAVFYHPPCQQRSHFMGQPAVRVLRQIPGLTFEVSTADCCGVAGTYGLKAEKYQISRDIAETLFAQIDRNDPERVLCDSETCRWWIQGHTDVNSVHPIELVAEALPR